MVMVPKPPGSRQLISPAVAVLEIAPAKVLQGAVRLQGLASSPTPETQVRVAWAKAGAVAASRMVRTASVLRTRRCFMGCSSRSERLSVGRLFYVGSAVRSTYVLLLYKKVSNQ